MPLDMIVLRDNTHGTPVSKQTSNSKVIVLLGKEKSPKWPCSLDCNHGNNLNKGGKLHPVCYKVHNMCVFFVVVVLLFSCLKKPTQVFKQSVSIPQAVKMQKQCSCNVFDQVFAVKWLFKHSKHNIPSLLTKKWQLKCYSNVV